MGLNLEADIGDEANFNIGVNHVWYPIDGWGGEVRIEGQIGDTQHQAQPRPTFGRRSGGLLGEHRGRDPQRQGEQGRSPVRRALHARVGSFGFSLAHTSAALEAFPERGVDWTQSYPCARVGRAAAPIDRRGLPLMRLTLSIPSFGPFFPDGRLHEITDLARSAEAAGVDTVIVPDHVVMSENTQAYEWGPFPFPVDVPWLEPLTVLAAIAGATTRVRLATGILIAPLRPAIVLAKTAATLDVLSRGRLELGVGVGWQREEFAAAGLDFSERAQRLDDTLAACRVLWRDAPASFASPTVSFEKIWCEPCPVQAGGVPVWFSGTLHGRNLRRIVSWGDGWIPIMTATRADLAEGSARLREAFSAAGRDPGALKVRGSLAVRTGASGRPDLAGTLAGAPDLVRAGATDVQLPLLAFVRRPEQLGDFFGALAEQWARVSGAAPAAASAERAGA